MTRRHIRIVLAAGAAVAIAACVYGALSFARSSVDRSDARLRARGYPITLDELRQWHQSESPGPEENGALQYLSAAKSLEGSPEPGFEELPVTGGAGLPLLARGVSDRTRKEMLEYLSAHSEAYHLLEKAAGLEKSHYGGDSLKHTNFEPVLQALQLRAVQSIANGDGRQAVANVEALVRGADSLRGVPDFFACRMRSRWLEASARTAEYLINALALDAAQLERLGHALRPLPEDESLYLAMIGERCKGRAAVEQLTVFNARDFCGYFDHYLGIAEEGLPARAEDLSPEARDAWEKGKPYLPNLHALSRDYFDARAALETVRAAILVEKVRSEALPASMDGFPDEVQSVWPVDPYTGGPIGYRRMDAGFITFSTGHDGAGDGGLASNAEPNAHRDFGRHAIVFRVLK